MTSTHSIRAGTHLRAAEKLREQEFDCIDPQRSLALMEDVLELLERSKDALLLHCQEIRKKT